MSRARDLASSGVTSTVLSAKAPLASPDFTGTVDLTGTTISLDNDQISGDKVSGGTIGAGTFNGTIGTSATINAGSNVSGIGQLVGVSYNNNYNVEGNNVTLEDSKNYHCIASSFGNTSVAGNAEYYGIVEYSSVSVNSSGSVTITEHTTVNAGFDFVATNRSGSTPAQIKIDCDAGDLGYAVMMVFEQGSTMDNS